MSELNKEIKKEILEAIPVPVTEPEFKSTLTAEELAAAEDEIRGRSFSARNPHLGKMMNCGVCHLRHRAAQKCEQRFTNRVGDYEEFKEEKNEAGEVKLVPAYRTSIEAAINSLDGKGGYHDKPTPKSVVGAATFAKKRHHPHPSKIKLLFIERVRDVYTAWDDKFQKNLERVENEELKGKIEETYNSQFKNRLHAARIVAARKIRKVRESRDRVLRNITKDSRGINRVV